MRLLKLVLLSCIASASVNAGSPPTALDPKDVKVAILMFDGVEVIDFAAPFEVFTQAGFTVYTVSKDGKQIAASRGAQDPGRSFIRLGARGERGGGAGRSYP